MFPQNNREENIKKGRVLGTKTGSSREFIIYSPNKKEELPMNIKIPYQNLKAKQKKSIIKANHKKYKKVDKKEKTLVLNDGSVN